MGPGLPVRPTGVRSFAGVLVMRAVSLALGEGEVTCIQLTEKMFGTGQNRSFKRGVRLSRVFVRRGSTVFLKSQLTLIWESGVRPKTDYPWLSCKGQMWLSISRVTPDPQRRVKDSYFSDGLWTLISGSVDSVWTLCVVYHHLNKLLTYWTYFFLKFISFQGGFISDWLLEPKKI